MKKAVSIYMAIVAGLLISANTYAREGGGGCGPGKGGDYFHPMRGMERLMNNDGWMEKMGVTDEQKKALQEIGLRFEQESIGLEADLKTARLAMKQAMNSETIDREVVFKAMDSVQAAELKGKKAEMAAWLDARNVFTPEQQAAIKKKMCGMRGPRCKGDGEGHCEAPDGGMKCGKGGPGQGGCPMMKDAPDPEPMEKAE